MLGELRPRSVSAATREKVVAKRAEVLAELARMLPRATAMSRNTTIGDLAQWWLDNVQRHQVRASTWTKAEDRVHRIVATIGTIEVRKLNVEQIITWQSDLLKTLAPKTVGHHRQTRRIPCCWGARDRRGWQPRREYE